MALLDKNTLTLLRIPFSFFLMPLFLLALSQADGIIWHYTIVSFFIIHFLVYPASNGYNSYVDKDEESIGGIEKPPLPTKKLFFITLFLDSIALILSCILINYLFAACIFMYIIASRAYSSKQIRLKQYPIMGFLVVMIFQGAFTYYMAYIGITGKALTLNQTTWFILFACSFQIAGAYPLTQVYQHKQDLKDGVITLSYKLGYNGTFLFTAVMFTICTVFYYLYFNSASKTSNFYTIQLCFLPIVLYFSCWFYSVNKTITAANFKNTMRMNWIAAICMNICFSVLFILNHLS